MPPSSQALAGARRRAGTQQDLLAATVRLLEGGAPLATLSIADIAREADVSRATFYAHFRDRTALTEALAREQLAWLTAAGRPSGPRPGGPLTRDAVRGSVRELVDGWRERHVVIGAIIEMAEQDPAIRALWVGGIREVADVARRVFTGHWESGAADAPDHPDVVAESLTWMIERTCHQMLDGGHDPDALVDALSETVCRVVGVA
ncbi:MAG: TetR/AcrR family transcriptional regulator [Solirubrobacteraceae bacterium]|nr:TetR/AcrR family transcriptional regulator [Solirubrobacteraceae bacterium]